MRPTPSDVPLTPPRRLHRTRASTPTHQSPVTTSWTPPSPRFTPGQLSRTFSLTSVPIIFGSASPQPSAPGVPSFPTITGLDTLSQSSSSINHLAGPSGRQDTPARDFPDAHGGGWRGPSRTQHNPAGARGLGWSGIGSGGIGLNIINSPPLAESFLSQTPAPSANPRRSLSPTTPSSQNSSSFMTADEDNEVLTDNEDAASCFSLSFYMNSGKENDRTMDAGPEDGLDSANDKTPVIPYAVRIGPPGRRNEEAAPGPSSSFDRELQHTPPRRRSRARSLIHPPSGALPFPPAHDHEIVPHRPQGTNISPPATHNFSRPLLLPPHSPLVVQDPPVVLAHIADDEVDQRANHALPRPRPRHRMTPHSRSGGNDVEVGHTRVIPMQGSRTMEPRSGASQASGRARSSSVAASSSAGSRHSRGSSLIGSLNMDIPPAIAFLKDIVLDLWIDQEGFRAIRPQLHLQRLSNAGSCQSSSSSHSGQHGRSSSFSVPDGSMPPELDDWGVAHFIPKKKESWVFHYSALDGAPVLRRLTVDGDESRDFISRQASLTIKSNGLYFLEGTEDKGKLNWKFEYIVEDRRSPTTGLPISGEKNFTPLTFSCSPFLLHPDKGKKVKLFSIMRKSVTPRLSSSKIEPPSVPYSPADGLFPASANSSSVFGSESSTGSGMSKKLDALSRAISRPSTPKRPTTPRKPVTPKRPSTGREDQPEPASADSGLLQKSRQRAVSLSANARPSTATRTDWNKLYPVSQLNEPPVEEPSTSQQPVVSRTIRHRRSRLAPEQSRPSGGSTIAASVATGMRAPGPSGKIVTAAQIQDWLLSADAAGTLHRRHASGTAGLQPRTPQQKRPLIQQRPSTGTDDRPGEWI